MNQNNKLLKHLIFCLLILFALISGVMERDRNLERRHKSIACDMKFISSFGQFLPLWLLWTYWVTNFQASIYTTWLYEHLWDIKIDIIIILLIITVISTCTLIFTDFYFKDYFTYISKDYLWLHDMIYTCIYLEEALMM